MFKQRLFIQTVDGTSKSVFTRLGRALPKKLNPRATVDPSVEDMDARLVALLMAAMPERVRTQIYRMKGSECVVSVLCCMCATLNPGGEEESSSIVRFTWCL